MLIFEHSILDSGGALVSCSSLQLSARLVAYVVLQSMYVLQV